MNVFLRELSAYRKSTVIWCASLSAILLIFMSLYPAFTNDVTAAKQVLEQFPEALRTALNISLSSFFTIYGFYGYLLSFAILAGSIQAMNIGTGIISKEVSGKTADFLLSKPMTRAQVVSAKLAAALTIIVITNVVFAGVSYLVALMVATEKFAAGTLFLLASTMFLVQLVFLALGALFAVLIPKIKSVIAVSMPTVFTLYIIGTLGDVLGNDKVRYLSPFKFFDTTYIIKNVSLEGKFLGIEAAIVVVAVAASYIIYIKKDVRASA